MILVGISIGICLSICFYGIIYRTTLNKKFILDKQYQEKQYKLDQLEQECWELSDELSSNKILLNSLKEEMLILNTRKETVLESLKELEKQTQITVDAIYDKNYEKMSQRLEQSAATLGAQYQELEESCTKEYLSLLEELSQSVGKELKEKMEQLAIVKNTIRSWEDRVSAAVAENKRAAQELEQRDFYRVVISQEDIQEIHRLQEIIPYLRDQEALNKVIWKVYYEKPTTDLIGRVVGAERKTGIYKLTSLVDKKCYVGQAVDIASRWRQHIKRGLGAETPTRNKLYPAMQTIGIENFTFEIIEECNSLILDEREDYWQEYFHAKDYGYSIK